MVEPLDFYVTAGHTSFTVRNRLAGGVLYSMQPQLSTAMLDSAARIDIMLLNKFIVSTPTLFLGRGTAAFPLEMFF